MKEKKIVFWKIMFVFDLGKPDQNDYKREKIHFVFIFDFGFD